MPKELICVSPFELQWRDYQDPPLKAQEVRIRATFGAAKHGTELSLFSGVAANRGPFDEALGVFRPSEPHEAFPFGIGNMVVGEVIEAGPSVTSVKLGDRVLTYGSLKPTHTVSERECWLMPAGMPWQSAVCLDPADFALAALRDANLRIGDGLAVFGLGAIALILVQMARLAGADPIIAIDPLAARREIAKKLGATHTLNPREEDVGLALKAATQGRGVDVAIEYSGSVQALQGALRGRCVRRHSSLRCVPSALRGGPRPRCRGPHERAEPGFLEGLQ